MLFLDVSALTNNNNKCTDDVITNYAYKAAKLKTIFVKDGKNKTVKHKPNVAAQ